MSDDQAQMDVIYQALDRMETAWNALHPGELTDEERELIAQSLWFGMEELRAAVGEPSYFAAPAAQEPPDVATG